MSISLFGRAPTQYSDGLQPELLATCIISIVLISVFTAARIAVKISVSKVQIEDYFSILSWALAVTFDALFLTARHYGFGKHMEDIQNPDVVLKYVGIYLWIGIWAYGPIQAAAKTALSLQIYRFFCPTRSGRIWVVNTCLMVFNILWILAGTPPALVQCLPLSKIWDHSVVGVCHVNLEALFNVAGAFDVATDLLFLILPIWAISRLKMPMNQKRSVMAVFSIGILACVCSILRLVYGITLAPSDDVDKTFTFARPVMWVIAEVSAIIIVTCFPLMPRFWKIFIRRHKSTGRPDALKIINAFSEDKPGTRTHRDELELVSAASRCNRLVRVHYNTRLPSIAHQTVDREAEWTQHYGVQV